MTKVFKTVMIAFVATGIGLVGCTKKVIQQEPPPPPPPPPVVVEPPPPPPPIEEFKPVEDIDGKLRDVLKTIYFDFDKSDLRSDAIGKLEAIARFLQEHQSVRLLSEGNCDDRGSSEYNMGLGENRSKAVKKYLTSYGIGSDRIETTSFGKERPVRFNCGADDNCHQENRRAEWKVLAK